MIPDALAYNRMLTLLNRDTALCDLIAGGVVLEYDTQGSLPPGMPTTETKPLASLVDARFDFPVETMGGRGKGTRRLTITMGLLLYQPNRQTPALSIPGARLLREAQSVAFEAVLRCRPDPPEAGHKCLWANLDFLPRAASVFETTAAHTRRVIAWEVTLNKILNP